MSIEVNTPKTPEFEYPIARKSKYTNLVALFYGPVSAVVIQPTATSERIGYRGGVWDHHESDCWEPVEVTIKG